MKRSSLTLFVALVGSGCGGGGDTSEAADAGVDAAPDLTSPVGVIDPSDGSTGVERNAVVAVTFNEAVTSEAFDPDTFTLADDDGPVPGTLSYDASSMAVLFTPSKELSMLGKYTASMTTGIFDLAGNQLEEAISSQFVVRDGRWGAEASIESDYSDTWAQKPRVAFDSDANAMAVWTHFDGSQQHVWSARYTAGQGWGTAAAIEEEVDLGNVLNPQIAIDGSGNAIALWQKGNSAWTNYYTAGQGWGAAQSIDGSGNRVEEPRLALNAAGNAVAVWRNHDGTRNNIWSSRYIPGEGWNSPVLLETDNAGNAAGPQVAIGETGNAVAVWRQSDGTLVNMMASHFVVGAGWQAPVAIEANDAGNAIGNHVTIDAEDNVLAVWRQYDGTRFDLWSNRYIVGAGWGSAEIIEDNLGNPDAAQVSFDATGSALAVWHQREGSDTSIWSNRYTPETGWGSAERIHPQSTGHAFFPKISIAPNGTAIAVWHHGGQLGDDDIWSNRYKPSEGWLGATLVESDERGYGVDPSVAMDGEDNALVLWSQYDGSTEGILYNRFN